MPASTQCRPTTSPASRQWEAKVLTIITLYILAIGYIGLVGVIVLNREKA